MLASHMFMLKTFLFIVLDALRYRHLYVKVSLDVEEGVGARKTFCCSNTFSVTTFIVEIN